MKSHRFIPLLLVLLSVLCAKAQHSVRLSLPRLEQLSSQHVNQVMQDSEGYLWYATEGGGICRDDGHQMLVFRSDAEHPDLLGSNSVASLAEAEGRYIIIGTYHGAYLLDKHDYSIRRMEDVDDKRVDDIIISRKTGHWWLTANKKMYEYGKGGRLLDIYPASDKYIFRLHEDEQGFIWASEWEGGLLKLEDGRFVRFSNEREDSLYFSRISIDRQGRQLVANGWGRCYVQSDVEQEPWFQGTVLSRIAADSIRIANGLSERPTAVATDHQGSLWFSTGKNIRRKTKDTEQIVLSDTKDVSAMAFTKDGTLWLATIFGTVMTYKDGQLSTDNYASNEYGDAIVALQTDTAGRLVIVSDRYVRLYDPMKKTLRQQNIENDGTYRIELQETQPGKRWSQPQQKVTELIPQWIWWLLGILLILLVVLSGYILFLHRQRQRFLRSMIKGPATQKQISQEQTSRTDEWLQTAIAAVEKNIADEHYNVEQLSADLCMSRMTFYRKIQSATGQKPTEFIRTIRLRRAAEMLRESSKTVTEIAYATGFSSVSYFSRCFRNMFGMPPTQFS